MVPKRRETGVDKHEGGHWTLNWHDIMARELGDTLGKTLWKGNLVTHWA